MVFGIASKSDIERVRRELSEAFRELEGKRVKDARDTEDGIFRRVSSLPFQAVQVAGVTVTLESIVQHVMDRVESKIRQQISDAVANLDMKGLGDKIYEDLDFEAIQNRLADVLKEKVFTGLSRDEIVSAVAVAIVGDDDNEGVLDIDDVQYCKSNIRIMA